MDSKCLGTNVSLTTAGENKFVVNANDIIYCNYAACHCKLFITRSLKRVIVSVYVLQMYPGVGHTL